MKMQRIVSISILTVFLSLGIVSVCYAGDIHLMLPKFDEEKRTTSAGKALSFWSARKTEEGREYLETELGDFVDQFERPGYRVERIELWIEAKAESGGITKFFVSMEGAGGIRLTLMPKSR